MDVKVVYLYNGVLWWQNVRVGIEALGSSTSNPNGSFFWIHDTCIECLYTFWMRGIKANSLEDQPFWKIRKIKI